MSACDVNHSRGGDRYAAWDRVYSWIGAGAALGGLTGYLNAGALLGAGASGAAASTGLAAVVMAAVAGAIIGFFVGFAVNWFDRLHPHEPSRITMAGCVLCAGRNTGFFSDGDWTFNLGGPSLTLCYPTEAGLDKNEIRTRDAPDNGQAFPVVQPDSGEKALHCEISSHQGDYAAVGGAVGSVAGGAAGAAAGAAICAALGAVTAGIGLAACALIVATMAALGAAAGGLAGRAIGKAAGKIADEVSDFDERGESVSAGCAMKFTGRWVTDASHQWNEIHDVTHTKLIESIDCPANRSKTQSLVAAVDIGRHPSGRDP